MRRPQSFSIDANTTNGMQGLRLEAVSFTMDHWHSIRMLSFVTSNAKHHPYQSYTQEGFLKDS